MEHPVKRYLRDVRNAVFQCKPARRGLTVLPDDTFLTSYLKSGNTWTRFLIGNLMSKEPMTFLEIERRIPDIYLCSDRVLLKTPRPRIIKSHECFDARYPKVIYIVRDPRDVVLSKYRSGLKWGLSESISINDYVPGWIRGEHDLATRHTSWGDHVLSWLAMRGGRDTFLLVRYEDLHARLQEQLLRIAKFLGLEPTAEEVNRAIELSSAARMRSLERVESSEWALTKYTRRDVPFVGEAKAGGWRSSLPEACVRQIEAAWWPIMKALGYELVTNHVESGSPLLNPEVCEVLSAFARDPV
jgi:hypothetical protein